GRIERIPEAGEAGTRAAMMVPVKHDGQVVGVVQLMSDQGDYRREDVELFEGLVAQMAAAVRNARLQKDRRRLEVAEAAARAVAAGREQAAHVLGAGGGGILLLGEGGGVRLWNRAAERVTGVRTGEIRDRPMAEVIEEWPEIASRIPVAARGTNPRSVTLPLHIGGRDLWLSFVAVRSADGVVYAFRDLTYE